MSARGCCSFQPEMKLLIETFASLTKRQEDAVVRPGNTLLSAQGDTVARLTMAAVYPRRFYCYTDKDGVRQNRRNYQPRERLLSD